jgi:hypothetical protein
VKERRPDSRGRRSQRAKELGDTTYKERQVPNEHPSLSTENVARVLGGPRSTGAKHITCAKPHVQQAVERMKRGEKMEFGEP